jgi:hypothetical protein
LNCDTQDDIATYIAEKFAQKFPLNDGDDKEDGDDQDDEDGENNISYTCTVGTSYGEAIRFDKFCLELKLGVYKVRICD